MARSSKSNAQGVLLYSQADDPITRALISSSSLTFDLIVVSLKDLLEKATIFDEIREQSVRVRWKIGERSIVNSDRFYLINRVLSVPESLFVDFHQEDRAYALSEFQAYLTFAIQSFRRRLAHPGPFGLSGNYFSLPRQWHTVQQLNTQILVPDYYLGTVSLSPFKECLDRVVYSTPYNYYYWKPNHGSEAAEKASFAFIRPSGVPIIATVFGDMVKVFSYYDKDTDHVHRTHLVEETSRSVARAFGYTIAELLFFVEQDYLTFGMITHSPYASEKYAWFQGAVCETITNALMVA